MLKPTLGVLQFLWRRASDLSLVQWLFPGTWPFGASVVIGIVGSWIGAAKGLPSYLWLPLGLSVLVLALLLCHLVLWFKERTLKAKQQPLEIIFDPGNPARRFWSLESAPHPTDASRHVPYFETRLEVKNRSNKTVRNVRVSVARIGVISTRPAPMPFDTSRTPAIDINPGCFELVPIIRWPHPRIQAGMAAGESAVAYGPIEVVISADDTPAVIHRFNFDYQKDPMIYD